MTNRLKGLVGLGILAISLVLVSMSPTETHQNRKVVKYRFLHNGHYICIPAPARDAHIRQHTEEDSFDCTLEGMCAPGTNPGQPSGD